MPIEVNSSPLKLDVEKAKLSRKRSTSQALSLRLALANKQTNIIAAT